MWLTKFPAYRRGRLRSTKTQTAPFNTCFYFILEQKVREQTRACEYHLCHFFRQVEAFASQSGSFALTACVLFVAGISFGFLLGRRIPDSVSDSEGSLYRTLI